MKFPPRSRAGLLAQKKSRSLAGGRLFGGVDSALCYERNDPTTGGDEFKRSVAACAVFGRMG